jgi:hypothetical protein
MKTTAHAIAGTLAMLIVATFLGATIYAEATMDEGLILQTKRTILYGIGFLVAAMAITGGSGFSLASGRVGGIVDAKKKRMRVIAANGLLVMTPSAIWLYLRASDGSFGASFVIVQVIELAGGFFQLYLLGRNFRDGLRLSGRLRRFAARKTKAAG